MSITTLDISEPFFTTRVLENENSYTLNTKTIVLNLSEYPIKIEKQELRHLQSCLLYTSPSPRDVEESRMPSSA